LKPHQDKYWCIPPDANAEFVAAMEDVLEVYHRPYDREIPVVCMDEISKQLVGEVQPPIPAKPGRERLVDCEYRRNGTANLFMFVEPLGGRRRVLVTKRRTKVDWAHAVKRVLDEDYPEARRVCLVMDNLSTHTKGAFYEAFPPQEARRLAARLDIHYTPKHGSWLNIAEAELRVLAGQCLDRRIEDFSYLASEVAAWEADRNSQTAGVSWQFSTEDARVKLKRLYPSFEAATPPTDSSETDH